MARKSIFSQQIFLIAAFGSLSLVQFSAHHQACTAAEEEKVAAAKNAAASDAKSSADADPNSPKAQLSALKTEEQQLRRMGEAVKRTRKAAMDIINECTQPVEMMGEIDIIGQDIIPIMPQTAEGFGNQYVPPRPKYINLHMSHLSALVPILQDDIDQLIIPPDEKAFAEQPLQDLKGNMSDLQRHLKKLQDLTNNTTDYDLPSLMSSTRGVESACRGIDSARKKLLHEDIKLEHQEQKLDRQQEKQGK